MKFHSDKSIRIAALACVLLPFLSVASPAATYYVTPIGSDLNTGAQNSPWATVQKAANTVSAGDVVLVADGTYGGVNIGRGGTSTSPVTFRADGANVVINSSNASTPDNINIEGADYVVVEGFKVEDAERAGIRVAVSTGVVIRGNAIMRSAKWGIFTAYTPEIQLLNNICATAFEEHGIYVSNSNTASDNPVIRGNECYGNGHNGIQLNGDCQANGDGTITGALIEGNFVHDNGWKGFSLISVSDSRIQNNVIYNNGVAGVGAGGIHFTDEPSCNLPSSNNVCANNTVVEARIGAIRLTDGAASNMIFNNIAIANSGDTIVDETGGNSIDSGSNILGTSVGTLFEDASASDYRLSSSSGALNVGVPSFAGGDAPTIDVAGLARPSGAAFDAGAYERDGGAPPPPPPPTDGILNTHPRLFLTGGRLSELRAAACYDDAGNPLGSCTPSPQWETFKSLIDNTPDKAGPVEWALAYMVTGNTTYRDEALDHADQWVAAGWDAVRAKNYRFLYVRDYLRDVGLVYDWLYDEISASRRTAYRDYMLMLIFISWNDNSTSEQIYNPGGWGTDQPGNNFYYNFMLATTYGALALYGEDVSTFDYNGTTYNFELPFDGTNYTDMLEFVYAKYNDEAIPKALNTRGQGGGWHEGNQYGPSAMRHMFESMLMLKKAGGRDYFNDPSTNFPAETVYFLIYTTQPGGNILYNGGDAGREPRMILYDYDRHQMLCAADGLAGRPESEYAQYFVNHWATAMSIREMRAIDMLFYRPSLPESDVASLDLAYLADGYGWINSRSSWADDAVSVSFVSADKLAGHQHNDQNAFQLYRGTSGSAIDGWLVTDVQPFADGLRSSTGYHNTILVDPAHCQRTGTGTGDVTKFEFNSRYTYVVGSADDAYYDDQQVWCRSDDAGTKQLSVFQRELVHIQPGYVLVFDRVTPIGSSYTIKNNFHFHNQPVVTADLIEAENGDGKVFQKVLWPAGASVSRHDEQAEDSGKRIESWRIEVTDASPRPNYQFMNLFYVTSAGTQSMPDAVKVDSESNKMIGVKISDPVEDIILFFSNDPNGTPPAGSIIYDVGMDGATQHYLYNLLPSTEYSVEVAAHWGIYRVTIEQGKGKKTSEQGVLEFRVDAPALTALGR